MARGTLAGLSWIAATGALLAAGRLFVAAPYFVPSESMMPTLLPGDLLLAAKWPERIIRDPPARGDVILFRAPPAFRVVYVKRVIGLPGDLVAMADGVPVVNGRSLPRWRIADLIVPAGPRTPCDPPPGSRARREPEAAACRYPRYREMLPGGRMVDVLDLGRTAGDGMAPRRVPAGRLFVLGDDRDVSEDSRYPAGVDGAVGMVPLDAMVARGGIVIASADGSARWRTPASWWGALRWRRIGLRF